MPENDLDKQDGLYDNGMTEDQFNAIIDSVTKYYEPIVQNLGGTLVVERNWDDSTVNAYAERNDGNWNVHMFGGLARRPEITPDGFAMVLSHEIGHHLSGFPFVSDWAANEGQADTFATHVAANIIWTNNYSTITNVNSDGKNLCDKYLPANKDKNLCYREMNANYSLASLLAALGRTKVNFTTPDKTIVKKTNNEHPNAQCRLDTYVAGTLCGVLWDNSVIPKTETESAKYSCMGSKNGPYPIQARPLCWFHPS